MADISRILFPERPPDTELLHAINAAMAENITGETAAALRDRLLDAEQMWRYFCRRDEMNAEVHLADGEAASVRYSPITIAAERVAGYLSRLYYGEVVDYRTAIVNKD